MSTIIFDGTCIAADRQCTAGWRFPTTKLHRITLKDGSKAIFASAGNKSDGVAVAEWLRTAEDKPEVDNESFVALLIVNGVCHRMEERLNMYPVEAPHAIGSGRDFALGAIAAGKSAIEAVEIAAKFDPNTGLGVDFISVA